MVILRLLQYGGEIKASSDTKGVQYTVQGQKEKIKCFGYRQELINATALNR